MAIIAYDPLNPLFNLLGPGLTQRLLKFAHEHYTEGEPDRQVREFLARINIGDPGILLLAVVAEGELVGHALITLEKHGSRCWVFCWQCEVDKGNNGIVEGLIQLGKSWGKQFGATNIVMCTGRDKGFAKKYGFTQTRVLMTQPIEQPPQVIRTTGIVTKVMERPELVIDEDR